VSCLTRHAYFTPCAVYLIGIHDEWLMYGRNSYRQEPPVRTLRNSIAILRRQFLCVVPPLRMQTLHRNSGDSGCCVVPTTVALKKWYADNVERKQWPRKEAFLLEKTYEYNAI
jgi:hypothetical protein